MSDSGLINYAYSVVREADHYDQKVNFDYEGISFTVYP